MLTALSRGVLVLAPVAWPFATNDCRGLTNHRRRACTGRNLGVSALGYRVVEAEDGNGALALMDGTRRIDLLFADIVMPGGLNGLDLARRLRDLQPALNVIFTTGYSDDIVAQAGQLDAGAIVLRKPYNNEALVRALAQALT